jgi:23S rRNA pseudouridine2605 synthase
VEKVYRARVAPPRVSEPNLVRLRSGIELDDGVTSPARARQVSSGVVEIALREGRKRQVRRMCEAVGHTVLELERVRFGPLKLSGLKPGAHRRLTAPEVEQLRAAAGRSPA